MQYTETLAAVSFQPGLRMLCLLNDSWGLSFREVPRHFALLNHVPRAAA